MEIFFGIDELAFSASIRQCVDFLFFCKHSINKSLDLTLGKNNKIKCQPGTIYEHHTNYSKL